MLTCCYFLADEIKKALVHRSRIRKAYFKMLEEEGEAVPAKRGRTSEKKQNDGAQEDEYDQGSIGGDSRSEGKSSGESGSEDDDSEGESQGGFFEGEASTPKSNPGGISKHHQKPPQKIASTASKGRHHASQDPEDAPRRPMTYAERAALIKARKQEKRVAREAYSEKRREEHERREGLRQTHKRQMTKYTSRGQPKMGPRINRLLDKIKETST